jgi:hypothetical protein
MYAAIFVLEFIAVLGIAGCIKSITAVAGSYRTGFSAVAKAPQKHPQKYDLKTASAKLGINEVWLSAVIKEAQKSQPADLAVAAAVLNVSQNILMEALGMSGK